MSGDETVILIIEDEKEIAGFVELQLRSVWGWNFEGEDNVLEVYIHSLREKLEFDNMPRVIHTVRGVGYVIKEPL